MGRWLLALLLAACAALPAGAGTPIAGELGFSGQVLLDAGSAWTPAQVTARFAQGEGEAFAGNRPYPMRRADSIWIWLDVPRQRDAGVAVLSLAYAGLDMARLHTLSAAGEWTQVQAGDLTPVKDWVIPHRYPALPLALGPDAAQVALLQVQHSHPGTMPWRLETQGAFSASNHRSLLLLGVYLGLVLLVVVLGAVNSVMLRDPLHALYAANILILAVTQSTLTGLAGQFLWPSLSWWNDTAAMVMPMLSMLSAAAFVLAVVWPLPWRWLLRVFQGYLAIGVLITGIILVIGREPGFVLANLYFLAGIPVSIGPLVWFARERSRHGWWLVAGMAVLYLGALPIPLRNAGLLPMNGLTLYAPQFGAALEIPLLLIGLYLLSRRRRDAMVRHAALQTRDPVTGLSNDRLTRERLDHLVQRMKGQPGGSCVMRVRIGNYGQIVGEFGIQVGAVTSVHAAACLSLIIREGDTLGRLRDGDFLLVLERRLTEGQAMQEAARVVARGLAQPTRAPVTPPIRLYVAISLVAHESKNAEHLLAQLNLLLLDIATNPQKVIRVAQPRNQAPPKNGEPVPS